MSERGESSGAAFWEDADETEALQRYRALMNSIDDGIYQLDSGGRFVAVNDVIVELTGYAREELLGEHVSVLFDDEDVSTVERDIKRLRTNSIDRSEPLDLTVQTAEGEQVRCKGQVNLLEAEDTSQGTVGIVRETTYKKQSDENPSEREQELEARSAAMEESIDGIAILDENEEYVFANQAHADIYGYDDPESFLGETWRMCYDGEGLDYLEAGAMPALLEEGSWRGETTGMRKNGSTFPQELSLTVLDDGRYICIVRDITEQREREHELERYETLFRESRDVNGVLAPDGTFEYLTPSAAGVLGYDPVELVGENVFDYVHPEDRERVAEAYAGMVENPEREPKVEYRFEHADGSWIVLESRGRNLLDEPNVEGIVVYSRDVTERKEREQDLRETREQLEIATSAGSVGVWTWDIQENVLTADEYLAETYGMDPEEAAAGAPIEAFFEPMYEKDRERVWQKLDEAVEEKGEFEAEYRVRDADDNTRWVVSRAEVEYDDGPIRMHGAISDITERKERERKLEESERRYRTLVENFPNGAVALFDEDLRYRVAGGDIHEHLDLSTEEVVGQTVWERYPEELAERLEPNFRAAVEESETNEFEIEFHDRHWRAYTLPIRDSEGDVFAGMMMVQDVTEQVERERYLSDAKAQLEAAAEAGAVGTWEWHIPDDRFVTGASFARKFGVNPEAARDGVPLERLVSSIHEADSERVEAKIEEAVESCGDYEAEYRVRNADDELRWVVARGHVECDEDGDPVTFPGALTDITERKQFEQQLEESNERLEQFAYAASHDLQEPLRMVTSYLQMIERRYSDELDEDGEEFIEFAVDGAERMRDMIEGLLEYSRVDTRAGPFEPVDLNDVIADVRDDLQVRIEESDADITADSLPRIDGDEGQLRQVFQNLLDNAIEYSGDEPPEVSISADQDGAEWVISVSDDGVGIDPDDNERVFEVFQSLHAKEHGGTGIGLALCERIVERHGGDIWVESGPGEGATFSFTLPAEGEHSE